ncbi:MAG: MqnA/MqnD/SBP family protein, partial [Planctomycetota bacterium]
MFLRRPPARVGTVHLDPASRTSSALALLLLRAVYGGDPAVVERADDADAELVIGDRALVRGRGSEPHLDLAAAWKEWTAAPFVFAAWYGPADSLGGSSKVSG